MVLRSLVSLRMILCQMFILDNSLLTATDAASTNADPDLIVFHLASGTERLSYRCNRCCYTDIRIYMWLYGVQLFLFGLKMILTCPPEAKSNHMHTPHDSPLQRYHERGGILLFVCCGHDIMKRWVLCAWKNTAGAALTAALNSEIHDINNQMWSFKQRWLLWPLKAAKMRVCEEQRRWRVL